MEIKPVYVTFEQAKWLKEKGFGLETKTFYASNGKVCDGVYDFDDWCFRPEQHVVVEWLRVNHGIEIYLRPERNARIGITTYYYGICTICSTNHLETIEVVDLMNSKYPTPQAAYSAAFDYIKEKGLI
jgi:hypothetical protein